MKKKRIVTVDMARMFAIFCVILTHSVEGVWQMDVNSLNARKDSINLVILGLHTIGRMGVPVFMLLSGYLLLDREYDKDKIIKFWKRNMAGLLISTEIWIIIYYIFSCWLYKQKLQIGEIIPELLFYKNANANHLWYMGQIIGIYLFLPFVAIALKEITRKMSYFITGIAFLYLGLQSTVNIFRAASGKEALSSQVNMNFICGIYGILLILGWMIKKEYFEHVKTKILLIIMCISYIGVLYVQIFAYKHHIEYSLWYDSGLLIIASVCLLIVILRIKKVICKSLVTWFGYSSFAVYLIHNIFRMYFNKFMSDKHIFTSSGIVHFVMLFVVTMCLSNLAVLIISKNKKIAKVLFCMK